MLCIKCGKEIDDKAKFCPFCGEEMINTKNLGVKNTGKKSNLLLLLIACLTVAIIIFVTVFSIKEKNSYENKISGTWHLMIGGEYSYMDTIHFSDNGKVSLSVENPNKPTDGSITVASISYDGNYYIEDDFIYGNIEGIGSFEVTIRDDESIWVKFRGGTEVYVRSH